MDEVAQIRQHTDIVALISEFVPLKKMGRNFKTPCPFHNEKTPSFVVSPERQIWHCFGCGKGGDAYTFLMEYEHIDFGEALRVLSEKTGITLPKRKFIDPGVVSQKETVYTINRLTAEYYHYVLTKHPVGKNALAYLQEKRQMNEKLLKTFLIGYSPKSGNALVPYLLKKKQYKEKDLVDAGLAFYGRSGIFDFFKDRIMFALFDHRGNIVGFSGRAIASENMPKYINTRETLVYHKGDLFFGFATAKEEMRKTATAIIMEGEFDVISSFKAGIVNCLAVKGTALTENQVQLLSRFVQKVSLCFDQDSAGYEATKRSLPLLEKKGLTTSVIIVPNGKDPDEAVKVNESAFKKAVKNDVPVYDFLIDRLVHQYDPATAAGKKQITDELFPLLSVIDNAIIKEHYLKKLSSILNTSYEGLIEELEKQKKQEIVKEKIPLQHARRERQEVIEEYLLALLIQSEQGKSLLFQVVDIFGDHYSFAIPALQKLFSYLQTYQKSHAVFDSRDFLKILPQELVVTFDILFLLPLPKFNSGESVEKEGKRLARELKVLAIKKRMKALTEEIKAKEKTGERDALDALRGDLQAAIGQLQK